MLICASASKFFVLFYVLPSDVQYELHPRSLTNIRRKRKAKGKLVPKYACLRPTARVITLVQFVFQKVISTVARSVYLPEVRVRVPILK